MSVNKDVVTTIAGVLGAVATAAQPVMEASQGASLNNQGIAQLVLAAVVAILGFFTGRPQSGQF